MRIDKKSFDKQTDQAKTALGQDQSDDVPHRPLTDAELEKFATLILNFSQEMCGLDLFPYQHEFGWRIIYSVIAEDCDEITALFSRQSGKCLAKGTKILMYDGSVKAVEDIKEGDVLMGDDSTPRNVLSTCLGNERLWRVNPNSNGHESYVVNQSHILTGITSYDGRVVDRSVRSLLKLKCIESSFLGYKAKVSFPFKKVPVDPYWFGLWLGDGSSYDVGITTVDSEVVDYLTNLALLKGMRLSKYPEKNASDTYAITHGNCGGGNGGKKNPFRDALRDLGVNGNKRIADIYKINSEDIRLSVLAGIIDSDGHRPNIKGKENTCEVTFKSKLLAEDVQWLCRSLGFRAALECNQVKEKDYWRVRIYGELWKIPTLIKRKQYSCGKLRENPQSYGFTLVDEGLGNYYGFEIDGNKRFLLGDFTVTHNTEAVAVVVCGMMVMLPLLAATLKHEPRMTKFKDGLWCGIYAPHYEQSAIMWSRMKMRLYSKAAKEALLDPDIDIDLTGKHVSQNMTLPNGSYVDCGTAAPQAKIEGKTYHLILLEEAQDINPVIMRSSIHPMAAALAGSLVKIGTCNRSKSDFYLACKRNKRKDLASGTTRSKVRLHFEYDYTVAQKYNPRYRKYVAKERERLGEDSDDFKMKYRLHWMMERGMFVSEDLIRECGINTENQSLFVEKGKGNRKKKIEFKRPPNLVTYDPASVGLVAAIDVGRENSTVITIGKVFWDLPILHGGEERFPIHVYNWLELQGDNHEAQHPQILDFLKNYKLTDVIIDATGKGDPIYSRLAVELDKYDITVTPFIFSESSKDVGYKVFSQELSTRRFTYPSGYKASRSKKWQKFISQMTDLQKSWRGQKMVVSKPKDDNEARDDFPDSSMMLCWLVNVRGTMEIEEAPNMFVGRNARNSSSDLINDARYWYRSRFNPRQRGVRDSHRGRWD